MSNLHSADAPPLSLALIEQFATQKDWASLLDYTQTIKTYLNDDSLSEETSEHIFKAIRILSAHSRDSYSVEEIVFQYYPKIEMLITENTPVSLLTLFIEISTNIVSVFFAKTNIGNTVSIYNNIRKIIKKIPFNINVGRAYSALLVNYSSLIMHQGEIETGLVVIAQLEQLSLTSHDQRIAEHYSDALFNSIKILIGHTDKTPISYNQFETFSGLIKAFPDNRHIALRYTSAAVDLIITCQLSNNVKQAGVTYNSITHLPHIFPSSTIALEKAKAALYYVQLLADNTEIEKAYETFGNINKLSKMFPQDIPIHTTIINSAILLYEQTYSSKDNTSLTTELKRNIFKLALNIPSSSRDELLQKVKAIESINTIHSQKDEAKAATQEIKMLAGDAAQFTWINEYETKAIEKSNEARWWLCAMLLCSFAVATLASLVIFNDNFIGLYETLHNKGINAFLFISSTKLILFLTFSFCILFCSKNYTTCTHLKTTYSHKALALKTINSLTKLPKEHRPSEEAWHQTLDCIFTEPNLSTSAKKSDEVFLTSLVKKLISKEMNPKA
ncbi:MAG: hypothetical protein ACNI27_01180 [Desulfovibrio sp.]